MEEVGRDRGEREDDGEGGRGGGEKGKGMEKMDAINCTFL